MKLLLLVFVAVLATSCATDNPVNVNSNTDQIKAALVGEWELTITNVYWNGEPLGDVEEPLYWIIESISGNRVVITEPLKQGDTCDVTAPYGAYAFRITRRTETVRAELLGTMPSQDKFTGDFTDSLATGVMTYDVSAVKVQ